MSGPGPLGVRVLDALALEDLSLQGEDEEQNGRDKERKRAAEDGKASEDDKSKAGERAEQQDELERRSDRAGPLVLAVAVLAGRVGVGADDTAGLGDDVLEERAVLEGEEDVLGEQGQGRRAPVRELLDGAGSSQGQSSLR